MDDDVPENRLTGALFHAVSAVPSLLNGMCRTAGIGSAAPQPPWTIELRKKLPSMLEFDALVSEIGKLTGLIVEVKRGFLGAGEEDELAPRLEVRQLQNYASESVKLFRRCGLLYLTKDTIEPSVSETFRRWLSSSPIDGVTFGWLSWERVHAITEALQSQGGLGEVQVGVLSDLKDFLEDKSMVIQKLIQSEIEKLRRVPDDMAELWMTLDPKGYEMVHALRDQVHRNLGIPVDRDHFEPWGRMRRYGQKGDVATWWLYVRKDDAKPFWVCVDLSLPLKLYEVTIRVKSPQTYVRYLTDLRDHGHPSAQALSSLGLRDEDWMTKSREDPLLWESKLLRVAMRNASQLEELTLDSMQADIERGLRIVSEAL